MNKKMSLIAILLVAAASLGAQTPEGTVVYSLPRTSLVFEVEAEVQTFHAGPYAEYAKKYLGIDVRQSDETSCRITKVTMTPKTEADLSARYAFYGKPDALLAYSSQGLVSLAQSACDTAQWRFPSEAKADFSSRGITSNMTTESKSLYDSYNDTLVVQDVLVEKTADKRAAEAAEMIFSMRKFRVQIITGDTDMTYSGEAMGAAVAEMTRIEKEYLSLFTGYSQTSYQTFTAELVPEAKDVQKYIPFRVSDAAGIVAADNVSGTPVVLELVPEPAAAPAELNPAAKPLKGPFLYYRLPAICAVKLYRGTQLLLQSRIPVYQLGETLSVSVSNK